MPDKYILWRTANGWLLTDSANIYESRMKEYRIFPTLHEFANWARGFEKPTEIKPEKQLRNRNSARKSHARN